MNSPQSVGRGARPPMNTESILTLPPSSLKGAKPLTEQKKQEMKTTLISLTNYLERLEKYLKHKYNTYNAEQTNININNINNIGNRSL